MATIDTNQTRGGRVLTWANLRPDGTSIAITADEDKMKLSSKIRTIDNFTDIGNSSMKKLDYWDGMPDITDISTALSYFNEDRTVVFTGTSNGAYRRGHYYKCLPDADYSWLDAYISGATDVVRLDSSIIASPKSGDKIIIVDKDNDSKTIGQIYCEYVSDTEFYIKFNIPAANTTVTAYTYSQSTGVWGRDIALDDYCSLFTNGIVKSVDSTMTKFIRIHTTSVAQNKLPFNWTECATIANIPMYPYDTVKPENNVCYVNPTSTCFYFGTLESGLVSATFTVDISNLEDNRFYGNNVIYFDTENAMDISFNVLKSGASFKTYVVGDTVTSSGKYKALVEVLPDGTATIMVTRITGSSSTGTTTKAGYCYGFRYNLDSSSPAVTRIELSIGLTENGTATEEMKVVSSFTQMPCHEFRRCLVKDGKVNYYLFKTNSLYREDGKTPSNLTGEDGDVCVEMPKTYLRITVPYKPSTITAEGEEYCGVIDYLVSTSPIPDPPKNADGTYNGVYRLIFNGVHPLFRVGGEYELDEDGNFQYETKYDYTTDQFIPTDVRLRKAADVCYAAAFASVLCNHHLNTPTVNDATLKATAATVNDTITPQTDWWFVEDASYPRQSPGTAYGTTTADITKHEARSVAPYRNGSMVGVNIPGVYIELASDNPLYPSLMPGGCTTTFQCTTEASTPGDTKPSKEYTYKGSLSFVSSDGSAYTKDYTLSYSASAQTYGSTSYAAGWFLTDGHDLIAHAELADSVAFNSFSDLSWTVIDSAGSAVMTMSTADSTYKLTIGPSNYGNRNSNFDWNARSTWDTKMSGNPNWALNYRPAVSISRANFQYLHMNSQTTPAGGTEGKNFTLTFGSNEVEIERLNFDIHTDTYLPNGDYVCTFTWNPVLYNTDNSKIVSYWNSTKCQFNRWDYDAVITEKGSTDVSAWYRIERSPYTFDPNYSSDYVNSTGNADVRWMYNKYTKYTDERFALGNDYYRESTSASCGARFLNVPIYWSVGDKAPANILFTKNGTTYEAVAQDTILDADTIYYRAYTDTKYTHYQEPIHGGKILYELNSTTQKEESVWYKREMLAITDQNIAAHSVEAIVWESHMVDQYHQKIHLYDVGYKPETTFGPITDKYPLTSDTGIDEAVYTCNDKSENQLTRTWTYSDSSNRPFKVAFNNSKMCWTISRLDSEWQVLYNSIMCNPATFVWANVTVDNGSYFKRRPLVNAVTYDSTTLNIGLVPGLATSTGTVDFTCVDKDASYLDRKWINGVHRIEYITTTDTRTNAATGNAISYDFGGCWCLVKYSSSSFGDTEILDVLTSDLDTVMMYSSVFGTTNNLFRPLNSYARNSQRTYDEVSGDTTNTTLVYDYVQTTGSTKSKDALVFFVDENGNLPEYLKLLLADKYGVTTHKVFQPGIKYYTKSGTTYTKATVEPGATISGTYYEKVLDRIQIYADTMVDLQEAVSAAKAVVIPFFHWKYGSSWTSTFTYVPNTGKYHLTTDTKFINGETYYTRSGDVYTKATVDVGAAVPEDTYYEASKPYLYSSNYFVELIKPSDTRLMNSGKTVGSTVTTELGEYRMVLYNSNTTGTKNINTVLGGEYHGCWMGVAFTSGSGDAKYTVPFNTLGTGTSSQSSITPAFYTWNGRTSSKPWTLNDVGPFDAYLTYIADESATDVSDNALKNNERILRFDDIDTFVVKKKSPRAANCNTRLKQYMALMMVIDGATFDTQSGISTGKSWLASFDYARSTFSGRTAELGNVSGEILWNQDVDINIQFSDWSSTAQADTAKQVVAFNWRGFENPFGNIGEYEDGIIPCTKFIDGHEVTGYHECIDPNAYSDSMYMCNSYKNQLTYTLTTEATATSPIFSEYKPSGAYTWRIHSFPASGWIKRWDPLTFLPTRINSGDSLASSHYCCGYWWYGGLALSAWALSIRGTSNHQWLADVYMFTVSVTNEQPRHGTRLQF